MGARVAFIRQGKLFVSDGGTTREVRSHFGDQMVERVLRLHERHGWKSEEEEDMGPFSRRMLWGARPYDASTVPVFLRSVTRGGKGRDLSFFLETLEIGGLFDYSLEEDDELRVFHRERFRGRDLDRHPDHGRLAFAILHPNGTSHIAVSNEEGRRFEEVTEGDAADLAPSWVRGREGEIVFQSAGVGRNPRGAAIGLGPFSIGRLDLDTGRTDTLIEDERYDYLQPRMDGDGNLYYIRRPYEHPGARKLSPGQIAGDIVLFPYRLIRAFLHFFNAFSLMFSHKPLITSTGQPMTEEENARMFLWGRMLDARKAAGNSPKDDPSLAPADWILTRRSPDGSETVLRRGVVAFDLAPDGSVIWTNGFAIQRQVGEKAEPITTSTLIECVAALPCR